MAIDSKIVNTKVIEVYVLKMFPFQNRQYFVSTHIYIWGHFCESIVEKLCWLEMSYLTI